MFKNLQLKNKISIKLAMNNFIEINVPYKSSLASYIKGYYILFNWKNFRCEGIFMSDKRTLAMEILRIGLHYLHYKNEVIILDYQEFGEPVGCHSAEKLEKIIIKIEFEKDNFKEKKKF